MIANWTLGLILTRPKDEIGGGRFNISVARIHLSNPHFVKVREGRGFSEKPHQDFPDVSPPRLGYGFRTDVREGVRRNFR